VSRGLGALQREILEALTTEHETDRYVTVDRRPIYDLLAVKLTLAERVKGRKDRLYVPELQAVYVWITGAFTASFSRAVKTLVARGCLERHYFPTKDGGCDMSHTHFVSRHSDKR
jgi:hypothetical protein